MLTGNAFGYLADYLVWWLAYLSILVHTWCFFRFFPRRQYRKAGLALGNLLVFVCLLGAVSLVAESYLRFISVETDAFGMSLPARRWFAIHTRLNSLGCRDGEWVSEKPAGVKRIAFVGDSFTYGWGIERVEDRFPDRIQTWLEQRSPGSVEVMNVAKSGWDTGAQLRPIQDMIRLYGVDEVVLCYVPNDIEKLLPRTPAFDPIRPPEPVLVNLSSSCLVDHLYRRIWLPRVPTVRRYHDWLAEGFADTDLWRRHQEQLGAIIHHCREMSVTLRAVLLPYIRTSGSRFQPKQIHDTLRGFFEQNDVEVVDLLSVILNEEAADLVVNRQDTHPNERANELFAETIWQKFYEPHAP